ncbi:hypothetical protein [Labilithrix luteola]|nr:hypothetical protein [Labilithrix luteola]
MPRWLAFRGSYFAVRFAVVFAGLVGFGASSITACSSDSGASAAGEEEPGSTGEYGTSPDGDDSPRAEAGPGKQDASKSDAGDAGSDAAPSGDILGTLSGACGTIASMLTSPSPSIVNDQLTFVAGESYEKASLSPGGQRMFDTANAGGSSTESETMSFEVLHYCEGATLLKTETEVSYAPADASGGNKITDLLVEIDGKKVGVSVTRAYKPSNLVQTDAEVKALLEKKLGDILVSSSRVLPADKWVKQILHVFTANKSATDAVDRVYPMIDAAVRADTIVLVTETTGGGFIYCEPNPALGSECPPAP